MTKPWYYKLCCLYFNFILADSPFIWPTAADSSYISVCISTVTLSISFFARCFVIVFDNSLGSYSSPYDKHNMFWRSDWLIFGSKQLRRQSLIQRRGLVFYISEYLNKHNEWNSHGFFFSNSLILYTKYCFFKSLPVICHYFKDVEILKK